MGRNVLIHANSKWYAKNKAHVSEYNHEYYMNHKDKWGIKDTTAAAKMKAKSAGTGGFTKKTYTDNDPDFNDDNYDDRNRVGDSDFYVFINDKGQQVVLEEDTKWVIPAGSRLSKQQLKQLEKIDFSQMPNSTWEDFDRAVEDVLRGAGKDHSLEHSGMADIPALVDEAIDFLDSME